jgi:ribonucleotide monophosphatase NagD (HAD superfamily)
VIGDRPETDLALAEAETGCKSVLVLTGVATEPDNVKPIPDLVAADLAGAVSAITSTS